MKGDRPKQTIHTNPDSDADPNYSFRRAHPRNDDTIGEIAKFTDEEIAFLNGIGFEVVYSDGKKLESLRRPYLELKPLSGTDTNGMIVATNYPSSTIEDGISPADPNNSPAKVILSRLELAAIRCATDQKPFGPLQVIVADPVGLEVVKALKEKYPETKEYRYQRA